jgi:sigma-B regulation protein RsbU (phosphoserine phosphatase)
MLVLYTDGVTEAANTKDEQYGRDRLEQRIRDGIHLGARELIDFVYQDVQDFTDGRGADDDITFFIIKAIEKKKKRTTTANEGTR